MKLLERTVYLDQLKSSFQQVVLGKGQNVFIAGEAGIGKTALVRQFLADLDSPYLLLEGYSDSLFAARPLGPLFDIAPKLGEDFVRLLKENPNRNQIFPSVFEALDAQSKPVILLFEDIHWADEATMDFIRFLARRIKHLQCLFILTLRDNELPSSHPYNMILGELPPTDFHKFVLAPLSRETVGMLAEEARRNGEEIYRLTAGIPYYVQEVLASYHRGIPETVRDSILSLYHRQFDTTKSLWEMISVIPGRIELEILSKMQPTFPKVVELCFKAQILIHDGYAISFKHELFRTAIEESLSPFRRRELHKIVMDAMLEVTDIEVSPARIIHHARLAGDTKRLQELGPKAAQEAALLGSHLEAAKLYKLALEHKADLSTDQLAELYEKYGHECYLTNQIPEAIQALEQAIDYWQKENMLRKGNALRVLSRLHWFAGEIEKAEELGLKAIGLCGNAPESRELALAYSNMSQLMMLNDNREFCLSWGEKAINLAVSLDDQEVLCHGYNNIGTMLLRDPATTSLGEDKLRESLRIALEFQYHDHAARAYTNLGNAYVELHNDTAAESTLHEGINYCDERDLQSWLYHMQSSMAQMLLRTGRWQEAEALCHQLWQNPKQQTIVSLTLQSILSTIFIRRGEGSATAYIQSVAKEASGIRQLQRVIPALKVLLEYEWIYGVDPGYTEILHDCILKISEEKDPRSYAEIAFWIWKAKGILPEDMIVGNEQPNHHQRVMALKYLDQVKQGNPYLQALWMAEGDDELQRQALLQLKALGAHRTAERVEAQMRKQGIQRIPRGPRSSTKKNYAGLTEQQMHVLKLLSEGLQNKEIASQLFLSTKTIDHHISAILSKLDVHSRTKAVAKANEIGILK